MKERFRNKWKADALAYIEHEHSEERQAYLNRLGYHDEHYSFVEYRTPKGVLVEAVVKGKYTERWRMTYGEIVIESPMSISFADVHLSVSGYEWETYSDVPGFEHGIS